MRTNPSFADLMNEHEIPTISQYDFYRTIFPQGALKQEGEQTDEKQTGVIKVKTKELLLCDELQALSNDKICAGATMPLMSFTHPGKRPFELFALVFPVKIPTDMLKETALDALDDALFIRHKLRHPEPKICPTFTIVGDDDELYFVYALDKAFPMYRHFNKQLQNLYNALSRKIYECFDKYRDNRCKKPRPSQIFKGYPIVGSTTAKGSVYTAYGVGACYTIDMLNQLVPKADRLIYHESRMTLSEAEKLHPDWHRRRILQKRAPSSKRYFTNKPDLYRWFLNEAQTNIHTCLPGVLKTLASYAAKCSIPHFQFVSDLDELKNMLTERIPKEKLDKEYETAIFYAETIPEFLITWSLNHIEKISGLTFKRNKRNFRTRKEHLALVHKARSKKQIVAEWRKAHVNGTPKECIIDTGLAPATVYKWWDKCNIKTISTCERIKLWRQENPTGTVKACAMDLALSPTTVYKKWKICLEEPAIKPSKLTCPDCGAEMTKNTKKWFWERSGKYYGRITLTCETCGHYEQGKVHEVR